MASLKIAIIGYGVEGQAAYEYWQAGNSITICDQNTGVEIPEGVQSQLGDNYLADLSRFDLIVRSPFVHPRQLIAASSPDIVSKITSNTNEFFEVSPTKHIIGVTGTKGKGTTATLLTRLLEAAGKRVHLGGNIGVPALNLLKNDIQPEDWVVLELSSFQLVDLKRSPAIAICLMIAPEHLDWHPDTDEYFDAKSQLFRHQTTADTAIYYADNEASKRIASTSPAWKIPYGREPGAHLEEDNIVIAKQHIATTGELKLPGRHNLQNACAALTAAWQITQDVAALHGALIDFSGLPYRIEFRREVGGIRYYNDSFASTPPASLAALESVPGKKVIILGGFDRGLNLDELCRGLLAERENLAGILLVGASAKRLADSLKDHGLGDFTLSDAHDMAAIVKQATALAHSGESVILSPGFASFDMFKNFEDRGQQFNTVVAAL
jgi:UDP-N-acetylmuramoylalanine--D-glutamate ligase